MGSTWIDEYLNDTKEIRDDYKKNRAEYGWNVDGAETVRLNGKRYSMFLYNDELRLFVGAPLTWKLINGKIPNWDRKSVLLSDIHYFSREGEVYIETKISGGASAGPNIGGAIVGGIIAGTAGAIIGGQSKIQPIKSQSIRHDERKTVLVHDKGKMEFAPEDYDVLIKLIPEKELSVVQQRQIEEGAMSNQKSLTNILRELKSMLDEGLITQEEYVAKKADVLSKI